MHYKTTTPGNITQHSTTELGGVEVGEANVRLMFLQNSIPASSGSPANVQFIESPSPGLCRHSLMEDSEKDADCCRDLVGSQRRFVNVV